VITAHLPAGYVVGRTMPAAPLVLPAALVGAVLPDADLIWFYLIDERAFHHHRYWVHAPGFWLAVAALALPAIRAPAPRFLLAGTAFFASIFVHLLLDSLAGSIIWLWPFDDTLYALVEVPATRSHWVLSFLTHWTILAELAVWAAAASLWTRPRRRT